MKSLKFLSFKKLKFSFKQHERESAALFLKVKTEDVLKKRTSCGLLLKQTSKQYFMLEAL